MEEALDNAIGELKRADHLIYVSLKYTRTVDMLKHAINRLITAINYALEALLIHAKNNKKIDEIPPSQGIRTKLIQATFSDDDKLLGYLEFFSILRKLDKADFTRAREFRRHVTMTADVERKSMIVNIDIIHEYFDKTKEIVRYIRELVEENK